MDRIILRVVLGLVGLGFGYFVFNHQSTPEVNASLDAAALERALVLPMGDLVWELEPDAAFTRSAQTGRPVLMLFTAEWCGPCRALHDGPLEDAEVQAALMEQYIPLYMDITKRGDTPAQKMAAGYGVDTIPRFVVADAEGKELVNRSASMSTQDLLMWAE